jgi:uncharacterized protein (TIGR03437 family)
MFVMRIRGDLVRSVTVVLLLASGAVPAQNVSTAVRQQDLNYVANTLPPLHANFFFQLSPAAYSQAVSTLQGKISTLTDQEFYVQLAALVALAGDPHTYLYLQPGNTGMAGFNQAFPLTFKALDDGIFVTGASAAYAQASGTQLIGVESSSINTVWQKLATVIPATNPQWVQSEAQYYLTGQQVLQGLDLTPNAATTNLTFQTRAGAQFTLAVAPSSDPIVPFLSPTQGSLPEYLQNTNLNYWFTYDPTRQLLYFKYNACTEIPGEPFETTFTQQLLAAFDNNPVNTWVIDFRGNGGGNGNLITNLGLGLEERLGAFIANPNLRLYMILDKGTFSSAIDDAEGFLQPPPAGFPLPPGLNLSQLILTIGAPTGGPTGGYGEVANFTLPSGLFFGQYSTTPVPTPEWIQAGPALAPEIAVPLLSSDYFARHDPMLAAVLARAGNPPTAPTGNAIAVNGASFRVEQGVAAGSFASVFGTFPANVDEVAFGSTDAKLVFTGTSQINLVVPSPLAAGTTAVSVRMKGTQVANGTVTISAAGPGIFVAQNTDPTQPGAVLNQDSTVNSGTNRAAAGTVMQIFATGYGPLDTNNQAAVQVNIGETPATVQYSGPAPGYPGLWQINAVLPAGVTGQVPLYVAAQNIASNAVTIWVQ